MTSEGSFKSSWGTIETFSKVGTCEDNCHICGYEGNGFTEVSGHNGWDSYSYTLCPKCNSDRSVARELGIEVK